MDTNADQMKIEVKALTMAFGSYVVQRELNFGIRRGEVFIIMGGSGCGKSTLLRHLVGLIDPIAGSIFYDGENFTAASATRREAIIRRCGVMYQQGALWSNMTLAENIAFPLEEYSRLSRSAIGALARYKLALVGLRGFEDYYPSDISGGMRKRAALARALALDPDILFFDEPSAGLDPVTSQRLDDTILELRESLGTTVVIVTHELSSIFSVADRVVFLDAEARTMTALGSPQALLASPPNAAVEAFLTRNHTERPPP
jgi:phospholipid/cholesterol/gamma-HCH transport system ATP-binding protein